MEPAQKALYTVAPMHRFLKYRHRGFHYMWSFGSSSTVGRLSETTFERTSSIGGGKEISRLSFDEL